MSDRRKSGPDPVIAMGAQNAWRADDATTVLVPYLGAVTLGTVNGTQPPLPAADALLRGRQSVVFSGLGSYQGVIASPGDSQTLCWAGRVSAVNSGLLALTAAGAANTGSSLYTNGAISARRLVSNANFASSETIPVVIVAVLTAAQGQIWVNSRSVSAVDGTASATFTQATCIIGSLSTALLFPLTGAFGRAAVFNRALTAAEAAYVSVWWGSYYGIPIS